MIHKLKIQTIFFKDVEKRIKTFEVRNNDRSYKVGDILILKEYDPINKEYTGLECKREITYILPGRDSYGIDSEFVVLGIK